MTSVALPKEDNLPKIEDKKEPELSIPEVLMILEQRIINLEAALLRIRGAI